MMPASAWDVRLLIGEAEWCAKSVLGRGASGVVYLAELPSGEKAAFKCFYEPGQEMANELGVTAKLRACDPALCLAAPKDVIPEVTKEGDRIVRINGAAPSMVSPCCVSALPPGRSAMIRSGRWMWPRRARRCAPAPRVRSPS